MDGGLDDDDDDSESCLAGKEWGKEWEEVAGQWSTTPRVSPARSIGGASRVPSMMHELLFQSTYISFFFLSLLSSFPFCFSSYPRQLRRRLQQSHWPLYSSTPAGRPVGNGGILVHQQKLPPYLRSRKDLPVARAEPMRVSSRSLPVKRLAIRYKKYLSLMI